MSDKPMIVVHLVQGGFLTCLYTGDVRVLIVDEACKPDDRVYELSISSTPEEIDKLIGNSRIGSADDGTLSENQQQAIFAAHSRAIGRKFSVIKTGEPFAGLPEHLQPRGGYHD